MHGKKLAALLMLPMLMFVFVPFTSHAQSTNTYYLYVECDGSGAYGAYAQVSFLSHTVSVTCAPESGDHYNEISFPSQTSGLYSAVAIAGPLKQSAIGFFNPHSCFAEGEQFDPAISSWAYWELYTSGCD